MALALYSGIPPSAWEREDSRALVTALELLADSLESQDGSEE